MVIGRSLSLLVVSLVFGASAGEAWAGEADCKAVHDAIMKLTRTPVRAVVSTESFDAGGKVGVGELLRTQSTSYTKVNGQWIARPYDRKNEADGILQAMRNGQQTCTRLRSEPVDGQPADLYEHRNMNGQAGVVSQVWISPSLGLPLLSHSETLGAGGAVKLRQRARFDYSHVRGPV